MVLVLVLLFVYCVSCELMFELVCGFWDED